MVDHFVRNNYGVFTHGGSWKCEGMKEQTEGWLGDGLGKRVIFPIFDKVSFDEVTRSHF